MYVSYLYNELFNLFNFIFWIFFCKFLNEIVGCFWCGGKNFENNIEGGGGWLCYWYNNSRVILIKFWIFGLSKNYVLISFKISLRWY